MSKHPEVLWAQRSSSVVSEKNVVYLTVNLPDIIISTLQYDLTSTTLSFRATAGSAEQAEYAFNLDFFAEVDKEKSAYHLTSRSFVAKLRKKELQSEYWPRLTKEKLKTPFIKTDFSKWVDEDEQDGNPTIEDDEMMGGLPGGIPGMTDLDFSKMSAGDLGLDSGESPVANETPDSDSDSDDGPPPLE